MKSKENLSLCIGNADNNFIASVLLFWIFAKQGVKLINIWQMQLQDICLKRKILWIQLLSTTMTQGIGRRACTVQCWGTDFWLKQLPEYLSSRKLKGVSFIKSKQAKTLGDYDEKSSSRNLPHEIFAICHTCIFLVYTSLEN